MACVTTVRCSVKFNGTLLEAFTPTRHPPFLFLLVADGFSALLKHEMDQNNITAIKVCRRASSHLLFVDDTLLFFRASGAQALRVKHALDIYATGTGTEQFIIPSKCSIIFSKD
jgi:hypothetical protein